ncbi:MAG: ABC transporter ATP-binding protein [Gemmatimonadaceae bacterium]
MLLAAPAPVVRTGRPPSRVPAVRVVDLTKRFATPRPWVDMLRASRAPMHTTALERVNLSASVGEIVGLLGPNGAGKTTLLKIASTLILPDAGTVEVAGVDVVRFPARARRLVSPVAADERSLEWRLSARENLRFYGALHGLAGAGLSREIDELLVAVELGDASEKRVGTYSSGMKQRLLIARGLLVRPQVLLLDEPTRSLDPLAARSFRSFLRREIAGRQQCTILLATHDPDEALDLCDRIAILDHGRVVMAGTPHELVHVYGEERYRVWVRTAGANHDVAAVAPMLCVRPELDSEGWSVGEVHIQPGDSATDFLSMLVRNGIPVARFEKVQPTVADLMDRVLQQHRREHDE